MPRTKQAGHTASKGPTINISDESSDDDIGTEQEEIRPAQVRPKKNPATDTKSTSSKVPIAKETAATLSKAAKGKGKAKIVDEDEMDVDAIDGKPLRRPASAMKISRNQDDLALAEENESLRRQLEALAEENEELQRTVDVIIAQQNPTKREEQLQREIASLEAIVERGRTLLDLRNSEYTKSKLINFDPNTPTEWVTMEWAEAARAQAMEEYAAENEELRARLVTAENAIKAERKEAADAKRQVAAVQRELEAEVEHSKKLAADVGRRAPPPAPFSTNASRNTGATRELEKKVELLEGLTSIGIVSYVETIKQPGNSRSMTYTCLLSWDDLEFPFKLVIWDEKQDGAEESEHVVYSPGEPIDPGLELGYLASPFTFPRSQMAVFYQNLMGVITGANDGEVDE